MDLLSRTSSVRLRLPARVLLPSRPHAHSLGAHQGQRLAGWRTRVHRRAKCLSARAVPLWKKCRNWVRREQLLIKPSVSLIGVTPINYWPCPRRKHRRSLLPRDPLLTHSRSEVAGIRSPGHCPYRQLTLCDHHSLAKDSKVLRKAQRHLNRWLRFILNPRQSSELRMSPLSPRTLRPRGQRSR